MKKGFSIALALVMLLGSLVSLSSCGQTLDTVENLLGTYTTEYAGTTLNVYNWAEYISDGSEGSLDIEAAFEKLTGIKVNYSTYESNEVMYSKLKSGSVSYDVVIPSDYMIERMINEGMLKKLDTSKLSNYNQINDRYKGLYYDPQDEYSVPYNVGMVGMVYNTKLVAEKPTSWNALWDARYAGKIIMFNNPRDGFAIAQALAGVDFNSTDKADWDKAGDKLRAQKPLLMGYLMDETFNKMEDGNAIVAPYYAGDCLTMIEVNPDLDFVYPSEGVNIFVDSMCIPEGAQNIEAAMMFINFMLEPEVALANAEYIRYASPNDGVLNNPDYSLKDSKVLYPDNLDEITKDYFHDLPVDILKYYEDMWVEITTG